MKSGVTISSLPYNKKDNGLLCRGVELNYSGSKFVL